MRLKSLEIQGFKSFATKSRYDFDHGVTAIVGPNGSGKSNIADAIRWVLGEQSYTNLRAQKTMDMIFSGSDSRARMGMAYVSLVLDNSDGSLPLDYNEVTIARRAYRSGENEYLINNNRVRLKDIAEILARGGLARQTYTLVGQGTIDRALSLRSNERRQLFEEAAGITYHRQRRAETLRRLDDTRQNLLRVNDIVQEIEPRLKRLARQVTRVEDYHKIRRHLDSLLKVWYGYLWGQGQQTLHHARVRDTIGQERLTEGQETLGETQAKIERVREQQTVIRVELGDWHAESSRLHAQAEAIQRELAVGEERARQLAAQREEFLTEINTLEETLKRRQRQTDQARTELTDIEAEYRSTETALRTVEQKLAKHKSERGTLIQQQRQAEEQARRAAHNQTDRESRLTQLAERLTDLQSRQEKVSQAIEDLHNQQHEIDRDLTSQQEKYTALEADLAQIQQSQAQKQAARQQLLEEANQLSASKADQEKQLASLKARQDVLSRLRNDLSGYHSGVKEILQSKSLNGIRGTVAQLIEVPSELEIAIETAVGGRLQEVVVDTWSNAQAAIDYLKKTDKGRATFLPLDHLRPSSALKVPNVKGVIGVGADLVTFDADISPAVKNLLNRLLIVEDLDAAKTAFDAMQGGFQIVTRAGEIVRSGGSVTGGKRNNRQQGGFLAREREWRELPNQISSIEAGVASLASQIHENGINTQSVEAEIADLHRQIEAASNSLNDAREQINQARAKHAEIRHQITWQEQSQANIAQDIAANQSQQTTFASEIEQFTRAREAAEQQATTLQDEIAALSAEALQAEQSRTSNQLALIQEKRRNQQNLLNNYQENLNQTQSQLGHRQARVKALGEQREMLLEQLASQQSEHSNLVTQVTAYTDKITPAEADLKALESEQMALEKTESQQRNQLRRLEMEANRFSLELARQQDKMQELQRQIEDDFGLVQLDLSEDQVGQTVLPIQSMVTQLPTVDEPPEGIEDDIRRLKMQVRQLGNINPDAPKEFAELNERHTFLTDQMNDLETAAADLKSIIEELDKIMETSFTETFSGVAKAFQEYFKILFNGGEAQLILTDPENIAETGIDIVARPPGKRLQNLELLSGGERSLTAQALIFALLKTSPTPYVIFDEVDAMLDEANVERFRKALVALSQDIQFIVITHNRKTIEVANTIYGVFMRENAISEAVSLKLDDFANQNSEHLMFEYAA